MKIINKAVLILLVIITQSAYADGGTREGFGAGNGGDSRAAIYSARALRIARYMQSLDYISEEKKTEILNRVSSLKVEWSNSVSLQCEGGEREICTFPHENRTVVLSSAWGSLESAPILQVQMIAHELLKLVELTDPSYMVSRSVASGYLGQIDLPQVVDPHLIFELPLNKRNFNGLYQTSPVMPAQVSMGGNLFQAYVADRSYSIRSIWGSCIRQPRSVAKAAALGACEQAGGIACRVVIEESERDFRTFNDTRSNSVEENHEDLSFSERQHGPWKKCLARAVVIDLGQFSW